MLFNPILYIFSQENYEYLISEDAVDIASDDGIGDVIDENLFNPSHAMQIQTSDTNELELNAIYTQRVSNAPDLQQPKQLGFYKSNNISIPLFDIARPHVCKVCKASFKYQTTLDRHMQKHEKPPLCTKTGLL